ncbi:MAG: flavodoxin-dependent (E)-4-hydroxy-3-methylbut-2-enyl-diphosphate synthase [Elusimicrobiota bacterium]|jgi:(E)-4-hydroxy-3-methylbut-2-enyl-diphosphate synthase|nr:flavodoxin-dependent (E)-4-hydroxy-3-methylbut-2-enyl-diphosphate synthase [Elusimicrobiota bacterium]
MKKRKVVKVGNIVIGGNNQVVVQSMTNTTTKDIIKTVKQIKRLERAGCELIRCSVPDEEAAKAISLIKSKVNLPIIADIHFDHKLAILSIKNGADKIRINPGNIRKEHLKEIISNAIDKDIAIRIGINAGSLNIGNIDKINALKKASIMVEKALEYIDYFENNKFKKLIVSLKSSDIKTTLTAYKIFSKKSTYPLHIGITESGSRFGGIIKSSIGISALLSANLGDTIRVSISDDPIFEIFAAYNILKCLNIRKKYPEIISCPTCARTTIDVINLVKKIENFIYSLDFSGDKTLPIKIAIMGCIVNGPGEAKEADFGICGTGNKISIFEKGNIVETFEKKELEKKFYKYLKKYNIISYHKINKVTYF